MPTRTTAMPLQAKLAVAAALLAPLTWWVADVRDRRGNEDRLSAIAATIAGKPVRIDCPGRLGRLLDSPVYAGTVEVGSDGRMGDEARLNAETCAELDELAEGDRGRALRCIGRSDSCGADPSRLAHAVGTLAHESWHLHGFRNEAKTECHALQTLAWTAQQLGATETEAHRLAVLEYELNFPLAPARYRSSACRDGGAGDLRPDDPRWP